MSLAAFQRFFDTSPAIRLLRSPNAAWILEFLQQQFKRSGSITQTHSTLATQLQAHLWELGSGLVDDQRDHDQRDDDQRDDDQSDIAAAEQADHLAQRTAIRKAEAYLATWCAKDCGWLKRFIDEQQTEPVYQLTADSELALAFVQKGTRDSSAIGTQSHLRSIVNLLNEVAAYDAETNADPMTNSQRDVALVREQFSLAVAQLEQLKSEFRAVEERFRSITRGVQQRLLAAEHSRGEILQFALDAEDVLKGGEHGASFFEFLKLVHNPTNQAQIADLVQKLTHLDVVADRYDELQSLRTMIPSLLTEAEKILRTTQHLSQVLRRLLDSRSTRHHQQLAQVLRDIRFQATALSQSPPLDVSAEVEVELNIQVPFDRPFWSQAEPFADVELQLVEDDPHEYALALEQLIALERIDWQAMRRNISMATQLDNAVSLVDLLERFPIRIGTVELLGYLQIAHEDGHRIDPLQTIDLPMDWDGARGRRLRLPQVEFVSQNERRRSRSV